MVIILLVLTTLFLMFYMKLRRRRHLCWVSIRKSKQGYCRLMTWKPPFAQIVQIVLLNVQF